MLLKIIQVGDQVLRNKAKKLTLQQVKEPATQNLIDLMIKTVRDNPGVGLAAPQVGEPLQIIVVEDKKKYQEKIESDILKERDRKPVSLMVIINPKLMINEKEKAYFFEGCLSVAGYMAVVPRAKAVTVTGLDRNGKPIKITARGWLARIFQHEVDHLNGCVYIDKMITKTFITSDSYSSQWAKASMKKINRYIGIVE